MCEDTDRRWIFKKFGTYQTDRERDKWEAGLPNDSGVGTDKCLGEHLNAYAAKQSCADANKGVEAFIQANAIRVLERPFMTRRDKGPDEGNKQVARDRFARWLDMTDLMEMHFEGSAVEEIKRLRDCIVGDLRRRGFDLSKDERGLWRITKAQ